MSNQKFLVRAIIGKPNLTVETKFLKTDVEYPIIGLYSLKSNFVSDISQAVFYASEEAATISMGAVIKILTDVETADQAKGLVNTDPEHHGKYIVKLSVVEFQMSSVIDHDLVITKSEDQKVNIVSNNPEKEQ